MNNLSDDATSDLPKGTVTFLFTDIEGSTELLRKLGEVAFQCVWDSGQKMTMEETVIFALDDLPFPGE